MDPGEMGTVMIVIFFIILVQMIGTIVLEIVLMHKLETLFTVIGVFWTVILGLIGVVYAISETLSIIIGAMS